MYALVISNDRRNKELKQGPREEDPKKQTAIKQDHRTKNKNINHKK